MTDPVKIWPAVASGTLAQLSAMAKTQAGRLFGSLKETAAADQQVFVEMPNNTLKPLAWGDLSNVDSLPDSLARQCLSPAGTVIWFADIVAPAGYLKCNGALLNRATYADLFAVIGTTFGAGDGSTTFALPDLRGEFIRGWREQRDIDADRIFGSHQLDALEDHSHRYVRPLVSTDMDRGTGGSSLFSLDNEEIPLTGGVDDESHKADETRPRNIALLPCIKY